MRRGRISVSALLSLPSALFLAAFFLLLLPAASVSAESLTDTHTIVVCSRLEGRSEPFASVSGGGSYAAGENAELLATEVSGFDFAGWYEDYSESASGTLVSSEKTLQICTDRDRSLTAVYRPRADAVFTVSITAPGFSVSGESGSLSGTGSFTVSAGTELTVSYENDAEAFICWKNGDGQIVSGFESVTFTVMRDVNLTAATVPEGKSYAQALIHFTDQSGNTISAVLGTTTDRIDFPEAPPVEKMVFTGWSMTEPQIYAAMYASNPITVRAQYRAMGTLTVSSAAIPATEAVRLTAGTKEQSVTFKNPSQNECWFRIFLYHSDGTLLWESAFIGPGETSGALVLSEALPKGTVSGAKLLYRCYLPDRYTALDQAELCVSLLVN